MMTMNLSHGIRISKTIYQKSRLETEEGSILVIESPLNPLPSSLSTKYFSYRSKVAT